MAIVIGDIHGCVEKVKAFLAYRPEELHVALGDYLDSFHESPERQLEAVRMLIKSDAVLLWGNHELHYLKTPPWYCTGRHWSNDYALKFMNLITRHKARFKAAYAVDGWLCSHAGVSLTLQKGNEDVSGIADDLNAAFARWSRKPEPYMRVNGDVTTPPDSIFKIGFGRGGGGVGGIFWFDFQRENGLAPVKQIFGHTETKEPVVTDSYIALDTTNDKKNCWLYDTATNELVRLDLPEWKPKPQSNEPELIFDLPAEEQEPFSEYLKAGCKSVPFQGGYWPTDYRRWKFMISPQYEISKDGVLKKHESGSEGVKQYRNPRIRDLPEEEQGPFREWLMGQTRPFVEGLPREDQDFFYQYDYERWKRHPHSWEHP